MPSNVIDTAAASGRGFPKKGSFLDATFKNAPIFQSTLNRGYFAGTLFIDEAVMVQAPQQVMHGVG